MTSITGKVKGNENEAMLRTMMDQRKDEDSRRRPELTDVPRVRQEVDRILEERVDWDGKDRVAFETKMGEKYVYLSTTFPILFKLAVEEKPERLFEFQELTKLTLDKIEEVQKGKLTKEECTKELLDNQYAPRFYSKN